MLNNSKSKKPANTAFNQQRLKSWQPLLTPKVVLPTYFIIGLFFIPIGVSLFIASQNVIEYTFDYTNCNQAPLTFTAPSDSSLGIKEWKYDPATSKCYIRVNIQKEMPAPVFMYYRLSNFYQNNRKYVKSFDLQQLKGAAIFSGLSADCDPLRTNDKDTWVMVGTTNTTVPAGSAVYYPCGLIANSLFSDVIENPVCVSSDYPFTQGVCGGANPITYELSSKGIAWPSDSERFKNTNYRDGFNATRVLPPPFWRTAFPAYVNGYTVENLPDLSTNEHFQVWMRTAGLPTFRKLWAKGSNLLPAGVWEIQVLYKFDTNYYSGTKSIVLSTVSVLGGKNPFLGIAYTSVGTICWALGIALLLRHMIKPRKLGDHTYLSWNQPSSS